MTDSAVLADLAPTGRLRAAINTGNAVLVQVGADGTPTGITVELARELGRRLGTPVDLRTYPGANAVFLDRDAGVWDIAFLAAEPERAAQIAFTPPYVHIEATFLVQAGSRYQSVHELDHAAARIATVQGAAYDLVLSRTLQHATVVRHKNLAEALAAFSAEGFDAVAGIRQALDAVAGAGMRVLPDSFSRIEQAMAVPKGRDAGLRHLAAFLEELKASGFIRACLDRAGQGDAVVAPPAS